MFHRWSAEPDLGRPVAQWAGPRLEIALMPGSTQGPEHGWYIQERPLSTRV